MHSDAAPRVSATVFRQPTRAPAVSAESLTGRLTGWTLLGTLALTTGFVVVTRLFWRYGLKRYTGASV